MKPSKEGLDNLEKKINEDLLRWLSEMSDLKKLILVSVAMTSLGKEPAGSLRSEVLELCLEHQNILNKYAKLFPEYMPTMDQQLRDFINRFKGECH